MCALHYRQCERLRMEIEGSGVDVDLVVVSPLTRTLQVPRTPCSLALPALSHSCSSLALRMSLPARTNRAHERASYRFKSVSERRHVSRRHGWAMCNRNASDPRLYSLSLAHLSNTHSLSACVLPLPCGSARAYVSVCLLA